ncbi:transposase [Flavobacterium sp. WG21]|uniref:transposase n=1 Tax=Flavobacterium sp. WG21 TaxID=1229487 RepID=UPI00037565E9|nr:transposase [Flavobacterium sp. WG21]
MEKPRQNYTLEFKQKAVELSNRYYSTIRAAKEVNTSPENIRRWKIQLQDGILGKKKKQAAPNRFQLKKFFFMIFIKTILVFCGKIGDNSTYSLVFFCIFIYTKLLH